MVEAREPWPQEGCPKVVTKRQPTADEWTALRFAWRVCAHVKSNTVIFTAQDRTLAIGAGQMSRVDAVKVAVMKAHRCAARVGRRVRRVLPVPRRPRRARRRRRDGGRAAGRVGARRGSDRRRRRARPRDGVHRQTALQALGSGYTLPRRSTALAVLLAVAIVPYFVDLGGSAIWDANEAFYVETPREMMEHARLRHSDLQLRAAPQQAGPQLLDRRGLLPRVRRVGRRAAGPDCRRCRSS